MNSLITSVPEPLLALAVAIFLLGLVSAIGMVRGSRKLIASRRRIATLLLGTVSPDNKLGDGLTLNRLEKLRSKANELKKEDLAIWGVIDRSFHKYEHQGANGWFITSSFQEMMPERLLVSGYSESFFQSIPGILTGLGLFGTFLALLLGLIHLQYSDAKVSGLDELINNLSGKFLTSVVALICSLVYVVIEKAFVERAISKSHDELLDSFSRSLPILTTTRILVDIQRSAVRQETSIGNISSDLVDRFVGIFKAELSPALAEGLSQEITVQLRNEFIPTIQNLAEAIRNLQVVVERLESGRHDSITSELKKAVEGLQEAVSTSLRDMGSQFHEQLTGAAKGEFGDVQQVLTNTADVLKQMNVQFGLVEKSLSEVISDTRRSTESHLQAGKDQAEALAKLITDLSIKLTENTDNSLKSVSGALLVVVEDLSRKMSAVSQAMVQTVGEAASRSQAAAQTVVQQAGDWSENMARRLEQVLGSVEIRSQEFTQAGQSLMAAHTSLSDTVQRNKQALDALGHASEQVKIYTSGLSELTSSSKDTQKQTLQLIVQMKSILEEIKAIENGNHETISKYQSVLKEYTVLFGAVDTRIAATMQTVNDNLRQYLQTVESNFNTIVTTSNNHLPQIALTLKDRIGELEVQLQELSDVMDRGLKSLGKAAAK